MKLTVWLTSGAWVFLWKGKTAQPLTWSCVDGPNCASCDQDKDVQAGRAPEGFVYRRLGEGQRKREVEKGKLVMLPQRITLVLVTLKSRPQARQGEVPGVRQDLPLRSDPDTALVTGAKSASFLERQFLHL